MKRLSDETINELYRLDYVETPAPLSTKPGYYAQFFWNCPKHIVLTTVTHQLQPNDLMAVAYDRLKNSFINLREIEGINVDEEGKAHFTNESEFISFVQALNAKINRNIRFN